MRASILFWSTASGLILGLFIDATLIGVALLFSALLPRGTAHGLPGRVMRPGYRWIGITAIALLVAIPLAMGVLGFLEGQLKAA